MTIGLAGLVPEVRERAELALAWARYYGLDPEVTSTYRTWAEQSRLYGQYQTCLAAGETVSPDNPKAACHYPANPPGQSAHNYGLAWDSVVEDHEWWTWTYLREAAGFYCPPNDRIHAEVPNWRIWAGTPAAPIRRG